jgi:hypothetical protein
MEPRMDLGGVASRQGYESQRGMFRCASAAEVIDPAWTLFSLSTRRHYDVLRSLDYLRRLAERINGPRGHRFGREEARYRRTTAAGEPPLRSVHFETFSVTVGCGLLGYYRFSTDGSVWW